MVWLKWVAAVLVIMAGLVLGTAWSIGYFATDSVFTTERGALDGYDVVAYFTRSEAIAGDPGITAEWAGVRWRFAQASHRDLFLADPAKYAPAYGGYCAWAMGNGYTAHGDPQQFAVVDGRLFLNFDAATKANWQAETGRLILAGDANWPDSRPGRKASTQE